MQDSIDLRELFTLLLKRARLIGLCTFAGALGSFLISQFLIVPSYTAEALLYINSASRPSESSNLNINDINASQKLVNTCIVIFNSDTVLDKLLRESGLPYSKQQLSSMISYEAVNNTEILRISATSKKPVDAAILANTVANIAPEQLLRVTKAGSVETISSAVTPDEPSSPNVLYNTAIGLLLGLALSACGVLALEMLDQTVKDSDDLLRRYRFPILGTIPNFNAPVRGGEPYGNR